MKFSLTSLKRSSQFAYSTASFLMFCRFFLVYGISVGMALEIVVGIAVEGIVVREAVPGIAEVVGITVLNEVAVPSDR